MSITLEQLLIKLENLNHFLDSQQNKTVDLDKTTTRVFGGSFLHQKTETMTEDESASFERNNKQTFDFLRSLNHEIKEILRT